MTPNASGVAMLTVDAAGVALLAADTARVVLLAVDIAVVLLLAAESVSAEELVSKLDSKARKDRDSAFQPLAVARTPQWERPSGELTHQN